jgi:hypothetical protein
MATIFGFDGFDHYATAGLARVNTRVIGAPTVDAGGRNSGQKLTCDAASGNGDWVVRGKGLETGPASLVVGAYFTVANLTTPFYLYDFRDVSYSNVLIRVNANGSISALRSDTTNGVNDFAAGGVGGLVLGTSAAGIVANATPITLSIKVVLSATVGEVHVYSGATHVLNLTGQNTLVGPFAHTFYLGMGCAYCATASTAVTFDDFWLADDYLGDVRVDAHYPTADGTYTAGVPSTGTAHYACVDEHPEPNATDYVSLASAGQRDSYGHEAFKNTGSSILAVAVVDTVIKGGIGTGSAATTLVADGATADGATVNLSNAAWIDLETVHQVSPGTGLAWTEAGFNASEPGTKRIA